MSKSINFTKMVATGNDFVVIDNRQGLVRNARSFASKVCPPHTGVGADGVLLLEDSKRAQFKMRIVNSDGSEAEACGNGFRCIARFARERMGFPAQFHFESLSGLIQAEVTGKKVQVGLVDPKQTQLRKEIVVNGHRLHYSFINTGVPHVVIFVQGLSKIDVDTLGRAVRQHDRFKPQGTNVNFVEVKNRREIQVRTYERGVEKETLACGTGSSASAIISGLLNYVSAPVRVKTSGGEVLTIGYKIRGKKVSNVTLAGEAHFVFEGELKNGQ